MRRRSLIGGSVAALLAGERAFGQPSSITTPAGLPIILPGPAPLGNGPSLDLNFLGGPDARVTTTRAAGGATYFDATGTLQLASANTQRIDYGPTQPTNYIRNSTNLGAVAGTPGTAPTNWNVFGAAGISPQIVAVTPSYIDIRWFGTVSGGPITPGVFFETNATIAAAQGKVFTSSATMAIVGGSLANLTGVGFNDYEFSSAPAFLTNGTNVVSLSATPSSQSYTRTIVNAATASVQPGFIIITAVSGAVDITIRFSQVQMELASAANPFIPTSGAAASSVTTNWVRNSAAAGSVAGTPGTNPTNWFTPTSGYGLTTSVVGNGVEGGLSYVDIRYFGTLSVAGGNVSTVFDTNYFPAVYGQTVTGSAYVRMVGGSRANVTTGVRFNEYNDGAGYVAGGNGVNVVTNAALNTQRYAYTYAMQSPTAATVTFLYILFLGASGTAVDITLRYAQPQLEINALSAGAPIITTGTAVTVGAIPKGLLVEESRVNSVRNPRAEGAVAGTPGTYPTNWSSATTLPGGIVQSVIGSGYENGIPYIDIAYTGTPTASSQAFFGFDVGSASSASSVAWSASGYLRLIAGSLANVTNVGFQANITTPNTVGIQLFTTPTNAPLASQRRSGSFIMSATATAITYFFVFALTSGQPINFTIRVGAPQLELGAFATSPILPAIGTPAATTRAADVANMAVGAWYNQPGGTLAVDANIPQQSTVLQGLAELDDGTNNNRVLLRVAAGAGPFISFVDVSGGVVQANLAINGAAGTFGTPFKVAATFAPGQQTTAFNGTAGATAAGALNPAGVTILNIGALNSGALPANGTIRRLRYWPRALSSGELSQVTT